MACRRGVQLLVIRNSWAYAPDMVVFFLAILSVGLFALGIPVFVAVGLPIVGVGALLSAGVCEVFFRFEGIRSRTGRRGCPTAGSGVSADRG